jgi:hypothetical protein
MAITAASVVPQMQKLTDLDDTGETWVWVKPTTARMDLLRANLLQSQEWTPDGRFIRVVVNPVELKHWQIYLSSGGEDGGIGNLILEEPAKEGEKPVRTKLMNKKRDKYANFREFQDDLLKCPPELITHWTSAIYEVNGSWIYPF